MPVVSVVRRADIPSFMEIVREVEPLFGPMPDFAGVLTRRIERGTALCVRETGGPVVGGMLLSGLDRAAIDWLAVRGSHRGGGIGRSLVLEALRRFPPPCEITVDTFGAGNPEGAAARRLYESFDFAPAEHLDRGPEGGTRQRFRLLRP